MPHWLLEARNAVVSGKKEDAAEILNTERIQQVLKEQPGQLKIVVIYGIVKLLRALGQFENAESLCKKLLKLQPENYVIYNEMGILSRKLGHLSETVNYFTKANELNPDDPKIWADLGINLARLGQTERGIEYIRRAVEKIPDCNWVHSNLLFLIHYLPELSRQEIFDEHKKWAQIHAPASRAKTEHNNTPDPDRKLRIGYISPDFCAHVVASYVEPLLDEHDRDIVEVYGYGNVEMPDEVTVNLRNKFDHYRDIWKVSDEDVARIIEEDKIDILVELTGHCKHNSLCALAYKPAPVQVTYVGYANTTGMQAIDYLLTDIQSVPLQSQKFYTEELVYLPKGALCYSPRAEAPDVTSLPAAENGYITFGAFTSTFRFNTPLLEVWAEILKRTPNSRLILGFRGGDNPQFQDRFLSQFEQYGISRERIDISDFKDYLAYLRQYSEVDIILDTFPENGGTTTCDALWMGVPVISLAGQYQNERAGLSTLTQIGLEFFVASTSDEYVSKAVTLAAKPDALAKIRESMRNRMIASTLCDKKLLVKEIEQAYRNIWKKWCNSKNVKVQGKDVNEKQYISCETGKKESAIKQMNCLEKVKNQYENYPYPARNPEDEKNTLFLANFAYLAKINHYCFKGKQNFNNSFTILDAGGGTGDATLMLAEQLIDTDARIVYFDMSSASMEIAKQRAKVRKLDNIKWVNGSILDIEKMGLGKFDYIHCTGVLHHLKNPDEGLKVLKNSLKENGAIGIMVYGQYGRTAIYQMQEMLKMVNAGQPDVEIMLQNTKAVLGSLPQTNTFKQVESLFSFPKNITNNNELHDLFLHSQDRAYTVPQIYKWVDDCGLNFIDFAEKKTSYKPQTFIDDPDLLNTINKLPIEKQQAIAELINSTLGIHFFYASTDTDTIADPTDLDNTPYFYRYCTLVNIYDSIKDAHVGTVVEMEDITEGTAKFTIGKHTKHILKHLTRTNTLKEIFQLVRAETDSANKPDDEELFKEFMNVYEPLNLLGLVVLRHKSVPDTKTESQMQNRLKKTNMSLEKSGK